MKPSKLSALLFLAGLIAFAPDTSAQNPSTAQAQQMLQNPALLQQLRQRIMSSGLTPDQVRARLRAEGYPEDLLDAYLPGATGGGNTNTSTDAVFSAITRLGIADTAEVDLLRCGIDTDSLSVADTTANGLVDSAATVQRLSARMAELRARCLV